MPQLIQSEIKLTIGMLVSNHVKYIRKAMEALQPLLKAVPSELIVIDTMGEKSDGSIDIVREYTDKIYRFEWCNDFSAARNFCLDHAKGEWFLYQDDDEWFDDVTELIEFFQSGEYKKYNAGHYYTRDYLQEGGYSVGIAGRMIRMAVNTRFEGRVHETFNEVYGPNKVFSCFTHHYGYMYADETESKAKQKRNLTILRSEIEEEGITPRRAAQFVLELIGSEETREEGHQKTMEFIPKLKQMGEIMDSCTQWLLVTSVRNFVGRDRYPQLLEQARFIRKSYPLTQTAELVLDLVVFFAAIGKNDINVAKEYGKFYLKQYDWRKIHEKESLSQVQLDFPNFLGEDYYFSVIHHMANISNQLQEFEEANQYWSRMPWNREDFDKSEYETDLQETMQGLKRKKEALEWRKKMSGKLVKSKIKLTIGMLVSNRIEYIRKTMESLKPLLTAIPSELIVVDTKGTETDGSIAIVREYTDKIYPFKWCDDFSAARNVCLDHAKGEWFLYIDDDEWFDDVTEFIEFFQSGECETYNSAWYYTHDYDDDGVYSVGIAGRMIRRCETTRFVGRVHETFNEVYKPNKVFSCFTHHYGYAFKTLEEAEQHQERNVSILKKEIVQKGTNSKLCAQMVQELMHLEKSALAGLQFALDALQRLEQKNHVKDNCFQWIIASTVRYFARKNDLEGAKKQLAYIEETYELSEITKLVLAGTMANIASYVGAIEDMFTYASLYLTYWDWKQEHEEEALTQINLDFPNFLEERYYYYIIHIGAVAANELKRYNVANSFWERIPWKKEGFDSNKYEKDFQITREGLQQQKGANITLSHMPIQNHIAISCLKQKGIEYIPKFIKSKVKLTIGMLVSNHIEYIRNCMESLKPLLEVVPSELVVIDTEGKNSDGSIDIVKEYTNKIYPFTWCDDFSAARNYCLEHSTGEWFLYLDDDEWFDDVTEFIDFFNSEECEQYFSGYYYTKSYLPDGTHSMEMAGRIIRRAENTRFVGRVHETFNEVFSPNKQFSCFTHHYGYAYTNAEERQKKKKRNIAILEREIKENGLNPRIAAQMAQELISNNEKNSYQFCMESIAVLEKNKMLMDSCSQWLLIASVRCFAEENQYEQLLKQADIIQKQYPLTETAKLVLAATIILTAVKEQDFDTVEHYASLYLENYDWRQSNKEEALLQTQLDFPKFFSEEYYLHIVNLLAVVANLKKDYILANKYWRRIPWERKDIDTSIYQKNLNTTIRGLQELKDKQYQEKLAKLVPLLEILMEASDQVKLNISLGNIELAKGFLVAMQETAITLGTGLDSLIGENSTTVKLLEQYCELLWNCNNAQTVEDGLVLAEFICEAVGLIQENFLRETRRKQTILLFPSKVKDWPLFEPYWREAKQNGDKVYVIPIPYFEKRYDGSLGEEFYEGENFPENILITKYSEYQYHNKLADLVVVRDNYDDKQVFYSVHPFYYIDNLKQYAKEVEIVSEWDGGVAELQRSMESLRKLLDEIKG